MAENYEANTIILLRSTYNPVLKLDWLAEQIFDSKSHHDVQTS